MLGRGREPQVIESRRLHWVKLSDPAQAVPRAQPGVDMRVILPADPGFAGVRRELDESGVPFRSVRYWLESEIITSVTLRGDLGPLVAVNGQGKTVTGAGAAAARDSFDLIWQAHAGTVGTPGAVPAADVVPDEWLELLPFPTLNPAQVQAAGPVVGGDGHVVVVAPTGAGKTVIGMMAALRAVKGERRKAAWLVPQRSLTDELDRELQPWRQAGLRIERLSGEFAIDAEKVKSADLWVATTEKFESVCRTWSLREALAEVGCLVVDEIHLLGDATRGPVLEALLARVRDADSRGFEGMGPSQRPVRVVGLSATVSNADEIAAWLGARLVTVAWRPSRLTWQLPVIKASSNRAAADAARMRLATRITSMVTEDDGSVLVFCGSKRAVRATALAIAASRGARVTNVGSDDLDRVYRVCHEARVGLHYKDWEHKREAEREFRERQLDVLVATTTVAAGVNLPARAVIVRDTQIGLDEMTVATVQQMFGRAGRIGAGETEGWAYLITDENERKTWQARLVAGYEVRSQILPALADHVLAEIVQGRVSTSGEAEDWWVQTLAFHQGNQDTGPVRAALTGLAEGGYLRTDAGTRTTATDLGVLTARMMVSAPVGQDLRAAVAQAPVPSDPDAAEEMLIGAVSRLVPVLADAPVPEDLRQAVAGLIAAGGDPARLWTDPDRDKGAPPARGDLAKAVLLTLARNPGLFARPRQRIAGIPYMTMYPVLEEAPHYLAWLGAQGYGGGVPPWCAIVAADLARRIRWRQCAPRRGAGRLLWMCEQMATPAYAEKAVPAMWASATARGITSPDWPAGPRPTGCRLDPAAYAALLSDRLAAKVLEDSARAEPNGAARFSRRGDYTASGWLAAYLRHQDP